MLDEYVSGDARRVCPEAPVPVVEATERWAGATDAVLLSDYGKGVVAAEFAGRVIAAARRAGCPVVVDPRGNDPLKYRGATVIKPNLGELAALTGRPVGTPARFAEAGQ